MSSLQTKNKNSIMIKDQIQIVSGMSLPRKNRIRKLHLFWDYHGQVLYMMFLNIQFL